MNSKVLSNSDTSGQKQRKNPSRKHRDAIRLKKFILSKHSNSMEPQAVTEVDKSSAVDSGETRCRDCPKPDPVEFCQAVQDKLASSPMGNLNTNIGTGETSSKNCPQPNPEEYPDQAIQDNASTILDKPSISPKDNCATAVSSHFVNSHFVNSHFVNSHLVNFPLRQFPLCQFPFGQC